MSSSLIYRPYVGVGVMIWKEDTLLLGKRINSDAENVWQFPGGHLEAGETVAECAIREVKEETGIQIKDIQQIGYTDDVFTSSGKHYVTLFVTASYANGEVQVMEPEKCESWQWFKYDELPQPLFLPITSYLKQHPDLSVYCRAVGTPEASHK